MSEELVFVDIFFFILMFMRLYFIVRVMLFYSKLFMDVFLWSIGVLNRINFDICFVLKILMYICLGIVMFVFIFFMWIIISWLLCVCER